MYPLYEEEISSLEDLIEILEEGEKDYYRGKIYSCKEVSEKIDTILESAFSYGIQSSDKII